MVQTYPKPVIMGYSLGLSKSELLAYDECGDPAYMIHAAVNVKFGARAFCCDTKPWSCIAVGGGRMPPRLSSKKSRDSHNRNIVRAALYQGFVLQVPVWGGGGRKLKTKKNKW